MLHLRNLLTLEHGRVRAHPERIERRPAGVIPVPRQVHPHGHQRVDAHFPRVLGTAHQNQLARGDDRQTAASRDVKPAETEVIQREVRRVQLGGADFPPHRLAQLEAAESRQRLRDGGADDAEHGPSPVQKLQLAVPVQIPRAPTRQPERVEPRVAAQRPVEMRGERVSEHAVGQKLSPRRPVVRRHRRPRRRPFAFHPRPLRFELGASILDALREPRPELGLGDGGEEDDGQRGEPEFRVFNTRLFEHLNKRDGGGDAEGDVEERGRDEVAEGAVDVC